MGMNWLDYAIIGVILLSTITGIFRGFIKELIAICIWALAIWLAYHYAGSLDNQLQGWVDDGRLRYGIGFILIMVMTLIVGGIANSLLGIIMKKSGLSATDRILGMGFGLVRGILLVSFGLVVFQMTSLSKQEGTQKSMLSSQFDPLVFLLKSKIPLLIQQIKTIDTHNQLAVFEQPNESMINNQTLTEVE